MRKKIRLTESDLHRIVKESVKRIVNEVALKGQSGKTYSLHGNDPEAWEIMSNLRNDDEDWDKSSRDENNFIDLDNELHPNPRSRYNFKRIEAMFNRIDNATDDISAARASKKR